MFWIVQVPDDAVQINGNTLTINVENVAVTDNLYFFGPGTAPATLSFSITYTASGAPREIEARSDPLGPFRWDGSMTPATNSGTFSVAYTDGSFTASGSFSSSGLFGEMGTERNGSYVQDENDQARPPLEAQAVPGKGTASPHYIPRTRTWRR